MWSRIKADIHRFVETCFLGPLVFRWRGTGEQTAHVYFRRTERLIGTRLGRRLLLRFSFVMCLGSADRITLKTYTLLGSFNLSTFVWMSFIIKVIKEMFRFFPGLIYNLFVVGLDVRGHIVSTQPNKCKSNITLHCCIETDGDSLSVHP